MVVVVVHVMHVVVAVVRSGGDSSSGGGDGVVGVGTHRGSKRIRRRFLRDSSRNQKDPFRIPWRFIRII